jgi:biopolymer transport protein ExbD
MGKVVYLHQHGVRRNNEAPISALNITPLIDVMLVLLVMLIIALPAAMHEVKVDLPAGVGQGDPIVEKLVLRNDGRTFWNGEAMADADLAAKLTATAKAGNELQFQTGANARYERFNHLIALVKRSGVEKVGFVGNSQFAKWDRPDIAEF